MTQRVAFKDPSNSEDWFAVASERAGDAGTLLEHAVKSIGALYMAGYAVECSFKGLLKLRGANIPKGREGHNLRNLLNSCSIPWSSVGDHRGVKSAFIDVWSVDLRYQGAMIPFGRSYVELVNAASSLSRYVKKLADREKSRSGRRRR
jgi:HEPN domain-containing protein